ncbi:MAG: alpha/beta hydrolase [Cyanobacteria bacterium J06638_6]
MPTIQLFFNILGIAGLVYLTLCGGLWISQRRLMYLPSSLVTTTPTALGIDYTDVWIPVTSTDQGYLHGWWLPAKSDHSLTILYFHGNAGNISDNLGKALELRSLGAAVLTVDYRGYGQSTGPFPNEQRLYQDAWAAWQYLHHEQGVAAHHLVIYGHSLGGAIAIELASRIPQLAGLVVEGSFTSMADMASQSQYNRWFPVRQLVNQRFDSLAKVQHLQTPTLYIHGLADTSVPVTMSEALYQATASPKSLWLVPNADHNDLTDWTGDEFKQRLHRFLQDYVLVQR